MVSEFCVGLESSALDTGFKAHAERGTGRYVRELFEYFQKTESESIDVLPFSQNKLFAGSLAAKCSEYLPFGKQTVRQQLFYPFWLRGRHTKQMDMLHFPVHIDAPSWTPKRYMVTVLDLIPLIFRDLYAPKKNSIRFRLARWLELQSIKNASLILTISQCTADDVHRLLGVPYEKMRVTPLGVREPFFEVQRGVDGAELDQKLGLDSEAPIVLYVGGIDQRKNMQVLCQIFSEVCREQASKGAPVPQLVLAGNIQGDAEYPRLKGWIDQYEIGSSVKELGYVEDSDLYKLYGRADVFLFPSLYEGFGLTPLEAMAAGTPVVSSGASAMSEVLGDAALLFEPNDVASGVKHVLQILRDTESAQKFSEMGRTQASAFTWEQTGQKTLQAYQEAADVL